MVTYSYDKKQANCATRLNKAKKHLWIQCNTVVCDRVSAHVKFSSISKEQRLITFDAATEIGAKLNYRLQADDTSIDADIYLFYQLRKLSLEQRIKMFVAHERGVKKLSLAGIKSRHRSASKEEIRCIFARALLAEKFPPNLQLIGVDENMWIQYSISFAGELHQLFESINIHYYVTGGIASSIHGEPRSTRDLDLVISVQPDQIDLLVTT